MEFVYLILFMTGVSLLLIAWIKPFRSQDPIPPEEDEEVDAVIEAYFSSLKQGHPEEEQLFYLDRADDGNWLIKSPDIRLTVGGSKPDAQGLVFQLNNSHRPNIEQPERNVVLVCFNQHEKGAKCEFETFRFHDK